MSDDPGELVLLKICRDDVQAMGVRAVLEAEGIEVLVLGEHHRAVEGPLLGAMIELRVMVRRADLADAREILEEEAFAEHLPSEPSNEPIDDPSILRFRERLADPDADLPLDRSTPKPRIPAVAVMLALFIPIGAGHLYARRPLFGAAVFAGVVLNFVLWLRGWFVSPAVLGLIAFDAIGSFLAVRRDLARTTSTTPRRAGELHGA